MWITIHQCFNLKVAQGLLPPTRSPLDPQGFSPTGATPGPDHGAPGVSAYPACLRFTQEPPAVGAGNMTAGPAPQRHGVLQ